MHSLRLQCQRLHFYRNASILLEKCVNLTSIKNCYSNYCTAAISNLDETDQFKAAVLHPKKQNLSIETLVLPESTADGMVCINKRNDKLLFNY